MGKIVALLLSVALFASCSGTVLHPLSLTSEELSLGVHHKNILKWSYGNTSGISFRVYRGAASGGPYKLIAGGGGGIVNPTYTDSNVVSGNTYYYVVTAYCKACSTKESKYSNEAFGTIP